MDARIVEGGRGEFTIWVNDELAVKKGWFLLPSDAKIIAGVGEMLNK